MKTNARIEKWQIESQRPLLSKRPWFEVYEQSVRLPDGRVIRDFYSIEIPEYVVVAAFDDLDRIVIEKQYRHGPRAVTWSLPAGYIEAGETPLDAARRELREETGYEADFWQPIGRYAVDGNRGCGWMNAFVAGELRNTAEPTHDDLADAEVHLMPRRDLLTLLRNGGIAELATAATLALALCGSPTRDSTPFGEASATTENDG